MLFLVDTGADNSLLMPADAAQIGLDLALLDCLGNGCSGVGGEAHCLAEDTVLSFTGTLRCFSYEIPLDYYPSGEGANGLPSILGRDVLDRWRMTYDPAARKLAFKVRSADRVEKRL